MDLLLHTICVEPARWTPRRVSRPLAGLLPPIAAAGFRQLEIFAPHLADRATWPEIRKLLERHHLEPLILSAYLNLHQASETEITATGETLHEFDFRQIRLWPGTRADLDDPNALSRLRDRLAALAERFSPAEILLETHDGSVADDPVAVVDLVRGLPGVALLYQPTIFEADAALRQLEIQLPLIRHVHLQNRRPDGTFARLGEGVVNWAEILSRLPACGLTLEFVPSGICSEESFDLDATLAEAKAEAAWIEALSRNDSATDEH